MSEKGVGKKKRKIYTRKNICYIEETISPSPLITSSHGDGSAGSECGLRFAARGAEIHYTC
jgi:hypothetical protein